MTKLNERDGDLNMTDLKQRFPQIVDLSDLQSADAESVQLLLKLVSLGTQIRGASPYVELLLKEQD